MTPKPNGHPNICDCEECEAIILNEMEDKRLAMRASLANVRRLNEEAKKRT